MKTSRKVLIVGCAIALVVAVWIASSRPKVRVLDQRFHLHGMKISHSTVHSMFEGNETEGRIRELAADFGLPIRKLRKTTLRTKNNTFGFMVRYSGDFPYDDLRSLRAEVVDRTGRVTPLRTAGGNYHPERNEHFTCWVLEMPLTGTGPFHVKLRFPESEIYLLDVELEKYESGP